MCLVVSPLLFLEGERIKVRGFSAVGGRSTTLTLAKLDEYAFPLNTESTNRKVTVLLAAKS